MNELLNDSLNNQVIKNVTPDNGASPLQNLEQLPQPMVINDQPNPLPNTNTNNINTNNSNTNNSNSNNNNNIGSEVYINPVSKTTTKFTFVIQNWSQKDQPFYSALHTFWDLTWKVYIFPKGNNTQDQLSLFLDCAEARNSQFPGVKVNFTMEILNYKNPEDSIRKQSDKILNQKNFDWGFNSFIQLSQLNSPNSGFVKDDTLQINVDIIQATIISNHMYDSKKYTGFVGLQNQGATCYMNSLLQSLYLISPFRKAVYELPTHQEEPTKSISLALQKLFFKLQFGDKSVATKELTKSFGWDTHDIFTQHDVQELNRVLCDKINDKMKGTIAEGTIDNLFRGKIKNFIKCVNVSYESKSEEFFYDLSLIVKGCKDLQNSFEKYTEMEKLEGNNKYYAEGHGFQVANKGVKFLSLPQVLHLHLKRFEYDMEKEDNVKINDRLKFPETLDLNKYIDEDEGDKSVKYNYYLQGVLVHSGDLHNGHYYAFLKNREGEWLKFDDDEVTKSNFHVVSDCSFGQDQPSQTNQFTMQRQQSNNAYMLIYFRDHEYKDLLKPIADQEIPDHLKQRIERDEIKENEQLIPIKLTRDEDFYNHHSFDLLQMDKFPIKLIKKNADVMTIGHLKKQLTAIYGIPMDRQRIWNWTMRRNDTNRIDKFPESDETTLLSIRERIGELKFHLEISVLPRILNSPQPNQPSTPLSGLFTGGNNNNHSNHQQELFPPISKDKENYALLFFKYFDYDNYSLSFMGSKVVDVNQKVSTIIPYLNSLVSLPSFNQNILLYEEITGVKIEPLIPRNTFAHCKIGNGDIIVFQKPISTTKPSSSSNLLSQANNSTGNNIRTNINPVLEYYQDIINTTIVSFRQIINGKHSKQPVFKLKLSKQMKYSEITKKIAQHINANYENIRLMSNPTRFDGNITPIKPNEYIKLNDILLQGNRFLDNLYFEVLHIPVSECDFNKNFKILYFTKNNSKDQNQSNIIFPPVLQTISLWVNKSGNVNNIILEFLKQTQIFEGFNTQDLNLHSPILQKIRLVEIRNNRIDKIFTNESVGEIFEHLILRADVLDDIEFKLLQDSGITNNINGNSNIRPQLIQVVHFNRVNGINHYHDSPFLLPLYIKGEKLSSLKERIQSKLSHIQTKDFSKWKLAFIKGIDKIEYLTNDDIIVTNLDWSYNTFIGLEHPNTPKNNSRNKAIKIDG